MITILGIGKKMSNYVYNFIDQTGGIVGLFFASLSKLFGMTKNQRRLLYIEVIRQIYFTGLMAVKLVVFIALILGFIVIFYLMQFTTIITPEIEGEIFSIIVIRELGPLLTAILVIGRSSTVISAEIATMMITHEFEALEISGSDTLQIIVLPRLIGVMISVFILNIFFDAVGIFGGMLANKLLNPDISYLSSILSFFQKFGTYDIVVVFIKSFLLGAVVSITSVYAGFKLPNHSYNIALSTQRGVMLGIMWVFSLNGFITALFYMTRLN